ncbi:MAG: ImmA/IrrE family metallo-endopeptidase [Dehalococcoidia bacterium]
MVTEAVVTPKLLRWARERQHLSTVSVAERVKVSQERLEEWELGDARPTFRQAQTLAHQLNVPFGYLFLSTPPSEELPLPDLRTVANEPPKQPSPELSDLLSDVLRKQQWYREYQREEGAQPLAFVGRYSAADKPEIIAANLREMVGINDEMRRRARSSDDYLRLLVAQTEAIGVLVLRSGVVENNTHRTLNVQEFRGFAISDPLAPLIFINGQDAKAGQIFTLAHELAHLWIGQSGISNVDAPAASSSTDNRSERLCNRVAAESLMPSDVFLLTWKPSESVENNLRTVALAFKVSAVAVLRKAHDLKLITDQTYRSRYGALLERHQGGGSQDGGGNFYSTLYARSSRTLTATLLTALAEGRVLHKEAAGLLNVKVSTLSRIRNDLLARRGMPIG